MSTPADILRRSVPRHTAVIPRPAPGYKPARGSRVLRSPLFGGESYPLVRAVADAGVDVEATAAMSAARGIVLRWVPQPRALRVSIGFFNDEQDVARLAAGLDDLTG